MSKQTNKQDAKADRNVPFKKSVASTKYKKAPNAPRRFKSSYMFFSTQKHKEIREKRNKEGENTKHLAATEVAKMVSQAWNNLSEEEREKWEEMGRKDKARYEMEKSMYDGPWKVPVTSKREQDPTRPKRPMCAFLAYSNRKRMEMKEKHKNTKTAEVCRILAQMWKDAPSEEKKEFINEEYRLRQEYKVAMAAWKERTSKEIAIQKEARENEAMKLVLEGKLPPDPFPLTSATALPTGAEYNAPMSEVPFNVCTSGDRKSSKGDIVRFPLVCNSYYREEDANGTRNVHANSYTNGVYVQSHSSQGYAPSLYPEYTLPGNAPPGYSWEEPVPMDSRHYSFYNPYYHFDPNPPYRYYHSSSS
ncbi:high mobility group box domain containing protein [Nitzschia inconspicua]|uniref:HMG high mobility group box-containing protein n=1 Tax=Nitzschia inconspicua TaxID=303405 RepID=A0A9K3K8Z6_9STRA|nr:HMG high mobility group box-containing protein [Nitzschia inconspicua]KAG7371515.1 high mobility group box domain containing protein [Nitzschia inconspicua]